MRSTLARMLVQIYEIASPAEARAVAAAGVDHVGVLVGAGEFPRERPIAEACATFAALPAGAKRVALSLSGDLEAIARIVAETAPDIIHLGAAPERVSLADARELRRRFPAVPLMRSIPVVDEASVALAKSYAGVADFLLLDSHDPADKQIGALGRTHDWRISRRIVEEVRVPAILAGGLGPDNVAAAIRAVRPAGVDSKTKTDRAGGHAKDLEKVAAFVRAVRSLSAKR
jgi:phosphoribosylanthranilate isomerase